MTKDTNTDLLDLEIGMLKAGLDAQLTALEVLRGEMQALAMILPGHHDGPRKDADVEADFDNMPV